MGSPQPRNPNDIPVPYTIPPWNGLPCHPYSLEVVEDGAIIGDFELNKKGAYMFGRLDSCDFVLDHPTISRFHAVIQFSSNGGEAYLYDLGSTHGTFINKNQVKKRAYVELRVGDVVCFGKSSRLYFFQGPSELMPPEGFVLRPKLEGESMDEGISWGMQEDAIEEDECDVDGMITWKTYEGKLTEKQEKTREKVVKRIENIAHLNIEIKAIRAKGGLTHGQQMQIARNEQRISQITEELENLEETLNESIRESFIARNGKSTKRGRKDELDYTAESLLEKKEGILKEMENKRKLLEQDDGETAQPNNEVGGELGDELDAYMSRVSSQLALENEAKLQKELASLQSELDKVLYLLNIADPTGEAARRRDSAARSSIGKVGSEPSLKSVGSETVPHDATDDAKDLKNKEGKLEVQDTTENVPIKSTS
ncbi:OLC1v1013646C1 [Oldenlandia corymbosa var. corymbosa]|uniref:OLC1v1013646C1 n=1 Tax=Oldenlandia corymbosa var. corymbosa TaxID=529605 RepID=A0AAV1DZ06_OLDCO|nr:OLC1v1013646C1 [Oldenlandia corymbosa var. corymbosa]